MKQITLDIEENQFDTFMAFLKTLNYVSIADELELPVAQTQELDRRLELLEKGQMKTRSWKEAQKDIFKRK